MCRLLAYQGTPNFISDHVFDPTHSLIEQSHHATKGKMSVNADGYGLAWMSERGEAAVFKDILPAWGCENLLHVATHIKSCTFIAHVRASTAAPVSRLNCHPFKYNGWAFAHNGQINEFQKIKREVEGNLSIDLYHAIQGQTDSEIIFLGLMDRKFDEDPVRATKSYIQYLEQVAIKNNIRIPLVLTAAMFKGDQLIMIRYASKGRSAPSLFRKGCEKGVCFASEPYENDGSWSEVQQNSITLCKRGEAPQVFDLTLK